jgi:hypothetical protein
MVSNSRIEDYSDEELRVELLRRAKSELHREMTEPIGLANLPVGAWADQAAAPATTKDNVTKNELAEIAKLARARTREILSIPIDPTADNAAATVRNINVAASTVLTLVSKLKPTQPDRPPQLLELADQVKKQISIYERPDLLEKLVSISDEELGNILAARQKIMQYQTDRLKALRNSESNARDQFSDGED